MSHFFSRRVRADELAVEAPPGVGSETGESDGLNARPTVPPKTEELPRTATKRANWFRSGKGREALTGYAFITPWIIGFLVFTLGAMIFSLVISLSNYQIATGRIQLIGLDNFVRLTEDPRVLTSLTNTLIYALMAVPLEILVALGLALLLSGVRRGSGVFRTVFYLPKMTPTVATASVFLLLLNGNQGAINRALAIIGIEGPQWLLDPNWVKPSIVLMTLWGVSGTMVIFLAALQNVPRELYEVAELDGAGPFRRFWSITLPMISPAMFFNVLVLSIAAFQVFDQAYLLFNRDSVQGSSDASLFFAVYLFLQAFRQFDFGFAAAMSWLLFVIIVVISVIQAQVGNRFVYYESER